MYCFFVLCFLLLRGVTLEVCTLQDCSHVYDPVCGMIEVENSGHILETYRNLCYFRKEICILDSQGQHVIKSKIMPSSLCGIPRKTHQYRRDADFSIIGAHEVCNHSCPTFCIDTYDPACAQIWNKGVKKSELRVMINHCHIDLFSCAVGVNVTILPLGKCFKNPSGLLFMNHMAAMKSLHLIEDGTVKMKTRRVNGENNNIFVLNTFKALNGFK